MNFSVLISVYHTENPKYLTRALRSIWDDQMLKPDQIVLVKDGPLTDELDQVISDWEMRLGDALDILQFEKNLGLGEALRIGINNCKYNLVARMDTDDISLPHRFKDQIDFFDDQPSSDIIGSNVGEFWDDEETINAFRVVPQTHEDIVKMAKLRNPFNHNSVMYKKSAVLEAGGPRNFTGFDDYYLWVRMIKKGAKCANIPKVLVKMRAGEGLILRRGGFNYLISEYKFQKTLCRIEYINFFEFLINLLIRLPLRIAPIRVRHFAYRLIRRRT